MQYARSTLLNTATLSSNVARTNDAAHVISESAPTYLENYGLRVVKPVAYGRPTTSQNVAKIPLTKPENDWLHSDSEESDPIYAVAKSRPFDARKSTEDTPRRTDSYDLVDGEPLLPQPPAYNSSCSDMDDDFFPDLKPDYLECTAGASCSVKHFTGNGRMSFQETFSDDIRLPTVGLARAPTGLSASRPPNARLSTATAVPPPMTTSNCETSSVMDLSTFVKSMRVTDREALTSSADPRSVTQATSSLALTPPATTPSNRKDTTSRALLNFGFSGVGGSKLLQDLESKFSETRQSVASTLGSVSTRTNKMFANIETEIISAALSAVLPTFVPAHDSPRPEANATDAPGTSQASNRRGSDRSDRFRRLF